MVSAVLKPIPRKADFIIGGEERPYLFRWYVIPRNPWFNIYLHKIVRSDDDRALHDHPWWNVSIILKGNYWEILPCCGTTIMRFRKSGDVVFRRAKQLHRLVLDEVGGPNPHTLHCWSLFITGPRIRDWGFACPKGWVHWKEFTGGANGELIGRGCGED